MLAHRTLPGAAAADEAAGRPQRPPQRTRLWDAPGAAVTDEAVGSPRGGPCGRGRGTLPGPPPWTRLWVAPGVAVADYVGRQDVLGAAVADKATGRPGAAPVDEVMGRPRGCRRR